MLAHRFGSDRNSILLISKTDSGPLLFHFNVHFSIVKIYISTILYLQPDIPECWYWMLSVFYHNIFEGKRNNCNRIRGFINIGELSLSTRRSCFKGWKDQYWINRCYQDKDKWLFSFDVNIM